MYINIEYKNKENDFPIFFNSIKNKKVCAIYDVNTQSYAKNFIGKIKNFGNTVVDVLFEDSELIPTEDKCLLAEKAAADCDYLLAIGAGTLNDMAKDISTRLAIPCGIFVTAPSMDGYASKGSALMVNGKKVTTEVNSPQDILIDLDIVCNAPKDMIAAGVGDILGKYTCLTDWQLSHYINNESIHFKAFNMMQDALNQCVESYQGLTTYQPESIAKLMNALITAGLSMAECGNSRPASGSEHHMSHFLEMDFVARAEKVPLHGVKVGIGTLVSIELYNYLYENKIVFKNSDKVYALIEKLPKVEKVREMLINVGCPVKFSDIGVRKKVMELMIKDAYKVRDRYTVLTLINELGLTGKITPLIMDKYY